MANNKRPYKDRQVPWAETACIAHYKSVKAGITRYVISDTRGFPKPQFIRPLIRKAPDYLVQTQSDSFLVEVKSGGSGKVNIKKADIEAYNKWEQFLGPIKIFLYHYSPDKNAKNIKRGSITPDVGDNVAKIIPLQYLNNLYNEAKDGQLFDGYKPTKEILWHNIDSQEIQDVLTEPQLLALHELHKKSDDSNINPDKDSQKQLHDKILRIKLHGIAKFLGQPNDEVMLELYKTMNANQYQVI